MTVPDEVLEEVRAARSVSLVDDVRWDRSRRRYAGSFLWHGLPCTPVTLRTLAQLAGRLADRTVERPAAVVGVVSSGLTWAAATALALGLPCVPLRLAPHRYGVWNGELPRFAGRACLLVDNFAGSGDTLREARRLLSAACVEVVGAVVAEGLGSHPDTQVMLETGAKLRALRAGGYFSSLGDEVADRFLAAPHGWLDDASWVRSVRRALRRVPRPAF